VPILEGTTIMASGAAVPLAHGAKRSSILKERMIANSFFDRLPELALTIRLSDFSSCLATFSPVSVITR
jgi:hypothetical protein